MTPDIDKPDHPPPKTPVRQIKIIDQTSAPPSARKINNKKIGDGYVKEEAKIIDERQEVKNALDDIINKVKKGHKAPSKEKKMEFHEKENDPDSEYEDIVEEKPKGKEYLLHLIVHKSQHFIT